MTESQRRVHLIMWLLVGPLAIGLLALTIAMRPASPSNSPGASAGMAP
ncbi:MAG: hypothetical protein ACF8R7_03885 [Phycisphaerales bacterium JB039]